MQKNNHHPPALSQNDRQLHVPTRQDTVALHQEQAASVVRQQISQIYDTNPPNQPATAQTELEAPYNRTHAPTFDWQKYHTAWQHYYQQYYQKYYWQQLHAERQRMAADAATKAVEQSVQSPTKNDGIITGEDSTYLPPQSGTAKLKEDLRRNIAERAKKVRRSHHFIPILSALAVGLIFLTLQFNSVLVAQAKAFISPGNFNNDNVIVNDPFAQEVVGTQPRLIIPKINEGMPVVYDVTALDDPTVQVALRRGVVHYKLPGANVLPGQYGNSVILGHSSADAFSQGDFKYVFLHLNRMSKGDLFYMHYEGKRYVYRVTETKIIKPSDIKSLQIGYDKPMVTLVTCTPPGVNFERLLVFGEQISPDPNTATKTEHPETPEDDTQGIPGNGPSFLEQVWGMFF